MSCDCGAHLVKDSFHAYWCRTVATPDYFNKTGVKLLQLYLDEVTPASEIIHFKMTLTLAPDYFYKYKKAGLKFLVRQSLVMDPEDHRWFRVGEPGQYELVFGDTDLERILKLE